MGGELSCYVDKNVLDVFLTYILGGNAASQVYPLADALPSFYLMIDRVAKVFVYGPCYVGKATFSAAAGSSEANQLKLTMEIEAENETEQNAGTFPAGIGAEHQPAVSLCRQRQRPFGRGDQLRSFGFELTVDNHLLVDRFVNELNALEISRRRPHGERELITPFTSTEAGLYGTAVGNFGTASAVFTNAEETINGTTSSLTFNMAGLFQYPAKSPIVRGPGQEIRLELDGIARKNGGTLELAITNTHG